VERHTRLLAPLAFFPPRTLAAIIDGTGQHDATVTSLAQPVQYRWASTPDGKRSEQTPGGRTLKIGLGALIGWLPVRVLPAPPPSSAQIRFPAVSEKTPGFPRHSRRPERRFPSLRRERTKRGAKTPPGLWLAQTLSRQILSPRTETRLRIVRAGTSVVSKS
jgi:hypothetical protein